LYFRDTLGGSTLAASPSETFIEAVNNLKQDGTAIANLNQLEPIQLAGNQQVQ
jgi:hypothetical protein